jgi:predicted transcriptional regulator
VARRRDFLIDRKLGSVIRMRRMNLGMSQTQLGEALGVSFQQIQKYEQGKTAIAATRIGDLGGTQDMKYVSPSRNTLKPCRPQ